MRSLILIGVGLFAVVVGIPAALAQRDYFELPPIRYSESAATDPMARLAQDWEAGRKKKPHGKPLKVLRTLLEQLEVPEESQVLVFSRTSQQNNLIRYRNPRAIYHSPDTYVGYVPGGSIEVASTDPSLGTVFYFLNMRKVERPDFVVRDNSCLQCHGTSRTELVPGLMVRSVFPDENGHPILAAGTYLTTDASPLKERWGGWFVTGRHGDFRHMGNTIAETGGTGRGAVDFDYEAGANWESLEDKIDTSKYLRPTSDIVSLMVLEHQCAVHNLLIKASMEYRRLAHLQRAIDPEADLEDPSGMAARSLEDSAREIVRALLFCDEADLGDGVEGDRIFTRAFEEAGREDSNGHSLRQFRLYGRIFRNRCSYMIHSGAFEALPEALRTRVLQTLWQALHGGHEDFAHIGSRERKRIVNIIRETVDRLPDCWASSGTVSREQSN